MGGAGWFGNFVKSRDSLYSSIDRRRERARNAPGGASPELLADHLARFQAGSITNEEVIETGGHGCWVKAKGDYATTLITGPRREKAKGLGRMSVVHGDMMLSGCFGLLEGARLIGALKE